MPRHTLDGLLAGVCLIYSALTGARDLPRAQEISPDRYSPLAQIDRHNVSQLEPVFSFRTGLRGAQGAAPLVVGSTLFSLLAFHEYKVDICTAFGEVAVAVHVARLELVRL